MHYSRFLPIALLATLVLPLAVWAQSPELILDHSGQLRRVLAGPRNVLFPDGEAGDDAMPVLAVETVTPAGDVTRLLVPGTEDSRLETAPLLFQDPKLDAFVLIWRSQGEAGDTQLDFTAFDGVEWSEVLTLEQDGAPVSLAGDLKIVETHDSFELELEDGTQVRAQRMIIHLLWQTGGETLRTHYAPLTFVAGRYLGWHGIFALDDLFLTAPASDGEDDAGEDPQPTVLTAALARALELRAKADGKSVLVTFANSSSNHIGSLEISPLPLEIGMLGEQVREGVLALADLYDPDDLSSFSDGISASIVIIGQRFNLHDAHAAYVADQVGDWILTSGDSYGWADFESLSAEVRDLAIDATREVTVSSSADAADPDSEIVRLDVSGLFDDPEPDPMLIFDVRTRADLPAPAIDDRPTAVFSSHRGDDLLVAWLSESGEQVHWVESREMQDGGPWSEVFSLTLTGELTVDTARQLLIKRIR